MSVPKLLDIDRWWPDRRRLHARHSIRYIGRRDGCDARADPAWRAQPESCAGADQRLAGRLLIGAGCVASIEGAAVSLGEHGLAPRFREAVERGTIEMHDATCPAIHAGLVAAEKGVPFLPIRGILGSDVLRYRPDWRVIDNPFAESGDPLVLVPAIRPDVALFHAPMADRTAMSGSGCGAN